MTATLELESDVVEAANQLAEQQNTTTPQLVTALINKAVSENSTIPENSPVPGRIMRNGIPVYPPISEKSVESVDPVGRPTKNGVPYFPARPGVKPMTQEEIYDLINVT